MRKTYLVCYDICDDRRLAKVQTTVDQVLFVDLGPVEGRGERQITALGKPYAPFDSPCIVVDGLKDIN